MRNVTLIIFGWSTVPSTHTDDWSDGKRKGRIYDVVLGMQEWSYVQIPVLPSPAISAGAPAPSDTERHWSSWPLLGAYTRIHHILPTGHKSACMLWCPTPPFVCVFLSSPCYRYSGTVVVQCTVGRYIHTLIDTTDDSACTVACCPELCNCSSPLSLIDGWISIIQQYQGRSSLATGQMLGARRMWARQSSQGVGWRRATGASRQVFLLPGGAPMASSLLYTRWTGMCMCLLEFIGQAAVADPFWLVMTSTNSARARVRAADHALQTIPVRSPSPYHNGCRVTYSSLRELMYVYWCCMQQMITFRSCLDPLADSR